MFLYLILSGYVHWSCLISQKLIKRNIKQLKVVIN